MVQRRTHYICEGNHRIKWKMNYCNFFKACKIDWRYYFMMTSCPLNQNMCQLFVTCSEDRRFSQRVETLRNNQDFFSSSPNPLTPAYPSVWELRQTVETLTIASLWRRWNWLGFTCRLILFLSGRSPHITYILTFQVNKADDRMNGRKESVLWKQEVKVLEFVSQGFSQVQDQVKTESTANWVLFKTKIWKELPY